MSDAAITTIVTGVVTCVTLIIGFLTLWVKLKHAATKAEAAATKAQEVELKLDSNTILTRSVDTKTDTIVEQTNGAMDKVRLLVEGVAERVNKLEDYNRTSSHRLHDAVNGLALKVERLLVMQGIKMPTSDPPKKESF